MLISMRHGSYFRHQSGNRAAVGQSLQNVIFVTGSVLIMRRAYL